MLHRVVLNGGLGIPVVFLHGFLGCAEDWEDVAKHLKAPSIALDLPGHGRSPFTPDADAALHEALPATPVHLVGYSMGGRLALQYAIRHPARIASLHLLSAHLGLATALERSARRERDELWAHKLRTLPIDDFLQQWYDQPLFRTRELNMHAFERRRRQTPELLAAALQAYSLSHQSDLATQLPSGTSLLVGEHDLAYRAFYRAHPHTVIESASHAAHLENPLAVAKAIASRLS